MVSDSPIVIGSRASTRSVSIRMSLFRLLKILEASTEFIAPDDSTEAEGDGSPLARPSYHRVIVGTSIAFAVAGVILGVVFLAGLMDMPDKPAGGAKLFLAPLVFAVIGMFFGLAVSCLFAPTGFLTGPFGQKWMKLIGTKSVPVARLVCLLLTLAIASVPTVAVLLSLIRG